MNTFEIRVHRDGKWWMVEIPQIDGLTQARRLSEVEDMARSFIAVDQDIAPSEIQLGHPQVIVSGEDLGSTMRDILEFRNAAQAAEEKAAALMIATARRLAKEQVPLRDIGEVLGVSHQRVHQLVREPNAKVAQAVRKAGTAAAPARKAAVHPSPGAAVASAKGSARRSTPTRKPG